MTRLPGRGQGLALLTLALLTLSCGPAQAQAGAYRAPRTPWGAPNLQGEWTNLSLTHLERPPGVPATVAKGDDLAAVERKVYDTILPADPLDSRSSEWWAPGGLAVIDGQMRTSWITSPADGRVPYRPEARRRMDAIRASAFTDYDGPESRNVSERCLIPTFSANTPPMQNAPYAANYRIVQTREAVVILSEIDGEARVVRLNAAHETRLGKAWDGDPVGRWEGETLVVESAGFHDIESFRAPVFYIGPDAKVTERFTRVSPTEIRYAFIVEDPATYTQAWRGEMPFRATAAPIYEYACHEGNNSLPGMLAGQRYIEAHPPATASR
jgi:hypothetical protein